jgi:Ni,Fe-hydrogenase maturation factor
MKNAIAILITGIFLTMSVPLHFAQAETVKTEQKAASNTERIKGIIISIDAAKNTVVIKDEANNKDKVIIVDAKTIGSLKVGEKVKVRLEAGTNKAESVKEQKKSYVEKK